MKTMKTSAAVCLTLASVDAATVRGPGSRPRRRLDMEGTVTSAGYDSYATAWRYIGSYLDCSSSSVSSQISSQFGRICTYCGGRASKTCKNPTRRLLWAAYANPNYRGNEIGEYQFYDSDGGWDSSTCTGQGRCRKMDCHDPYNSSWELMGVYKESVSFDNDEFFEQLFKHQGYCLWDGDKDGYDYDSQDYSSAYSNGSTYGFMQAMRKTLPEGCVSTSVFGNTYYIAMKPESGGDMTLGVYTDKYCTEESHYTYEDYQSAAGSSLGAIGIDGAFDAWNEGMDAYKICQPCRAYNREATEANGSGSWDNNRFLTEYNDGQGDEEANGFNCYDDAGYRNCNQCYKFETHSDMSAATGSDLANASSQGTILRIKYQGSWYGKGLVGDVTRGSEGSDDEDSGGEYQSSHARRSSHYKYSTSYSNAGAAMAVLMLGGAAVKVQRRRRRRGSIDGDVEDDGEDAYVEMAEPR